MIFQKEIPIVPFFTWLRNEKENKQTLVFGGLLIVAQFALFKFFYPFPNFMEPDSHNYVEAAFRNDFINIWPIGYSKFLRLMSSFTNSHFVLVTIQYLFLQAGIFYLLFTIKFMLSPGKWAFRLLLCANILNPLVIHISNFVSSDSLFAALSLIWFTQLLWIWCKSTIYLLVIHGLILLLAFMVRYNALYYPAISVAVIILATLPKRNKIIGISFTISLLGIFIGTTQYEYYKLYGSAQFSAFGGWQIASNALYGYAHSQHDPVENVPAKFKNLHVIVNNHMDSIARLKNRPDNEVAIYYLWNFKSPLRVYMEKEVQLRKDMNAAFLKKWALVSPLYAQYGRYLILNHPLEFLKYFAWPNLKKYYAPPVNFMDSYNMGSDKVNKTIEGWFGWRNQNLTLRFKDRAIKITSLFSELNAISNIVFVFGLLGILFLARTVSIPLQNKRVLLTTFFVWLLSMVFSVLAAPIELRYLIFPFTLTLNFGIILVSYIAHVSKGESRVKQSEDFKFKQPETTIQLP